MSTSTILGFLFIAEMAILGIGLSVYLYLQLKRLKQKLKEIRAANNNENTTKNLHDLFELLINRTRKKIAEKLSDDSEAEHKRQKTLLNQRIEYLKLEKDLLNDDSDNSTFWTKIYQRLASIINIEQPNTTPEYQELEIEAIPDLAKYKRRIANYQEQLSRVSKEFSDYRKYTKKFASGLSNYSADQKKDGILSKLVMDFSEQDEKVGQRLNQIQQDSENEPDNEKPASDKNKSGVTEFSSNKASEEEIHRLRDIISRQYNSLDELKLAILNADTSDQSAEDLTQKIQAVERSQKELQTCVDVLEMENQRLSDALIKAEAAGNSTPSEELEKLKLKNQGLEAQYLETDKKLKNLEIDYNSLQEEFMRLYSDKKE